MEEKNIQLKKFESMLETIERIKEMQAKEEESVFIELIGTPRSGKTTLKNVLEKLFKDSGVPYVARKSFSTYCPIKPENDMYNPFQFRSSGATGFRNSQYQHSGQAA